MSRRGFFGTLLGLLATPLAVPPRHACEELEAHPDWKDCKIYPKVEWQKGTIVIQGDGVARKVRIVRAKDYSTRIYS